MRKVLATTVAATMLAATAASAGTMPDWVKAPKADDFGVTAGVGSFGVMVEPTYKINDQFGLRMPLGQGNASFDINKNGAKYEGEFNTSGIALMADYHPFAGGLHLSAGATYTDYKFDGTAHNVTVNGTTSDIAVHVRQKEHFSPIAAVGYDKKIGPMTLSTDVGAIFSKGMSFSANDPSGTFTQSDIDSQTAGLKSDAEDFKVLPYFKVGLGFRF